MSLLKAIIFDFDGVILESVGVKGWAFGKLFEQFPEHTEKIVSYHHANGGVSRFDKFRYIYDQILKRPLSDEKFDDLCKKYSQLVFDKVISSEFVPGAFDILRKYSRVTSLFIVTGTPQEEMERVLRARELDGFFTAVYGSPEIKKSWTKKILNDYHLDPEQVVFVGDAMSDWEAAYENNIGFIACIPGGEDDIFTGKKVEHRISDLTGLDEYFEQRGVK